MKAVSTEAATVIDLFLAEHWSLFEQHCDEQGVDAEETAQELR